MQNKQLHRSIFWHRLRHTLQRILLVTFCFLLVLNTLLQTTALQSFIAQTASSYLSERLNIKIEIEQVRISLMMDVMLKGVTIEDSHQNEMITIKYFYTRLSAAQLARKSFRLSEVEMHEGGFTMRKYAGDSLFNYTDLIGKPDTLKKKSPGMSFELYCRSAKLKNCYFNMINENNPSRNGFDWNNMQLDLTKVEGRNIVVNNDEISVEVKDIVTSDVSGFKLNKFTSTIKWLDDGWYFDDTFILTPSSTLDFDLKFGYSSFNHIGEFVDSITIASTFRPSILDVQDIAYFAESLKPYTLITDIETKFNGTLKDFTVKDLKLDFGESSSLAMNGRFRGILEPETAIMDITIKQLTTSWKELDAFHLPIGNIALPSPLQEPITLTMQFNGAIKEFKTDFTLQTEIGQLASSIIMGWDETLNDYIYEADVSSGSIHVGALANASDILGDGIFHIKLKGAGLSLKNADIDVNAMLNSLVLMGYTYENVHVDGLFQEQKFNGFAGIADKNIDLAFNGIVDLSDSLPSFDFRLNLRDVYLSRLHLITGRKEDLRLSTDITMKAKGNSIDNILGLLRINDFSVIEGREVYRFDSLQMLTYQSDTANRNTRIRSDLLNARISGNYQLNQLGAAYHQLIGNYLASIGQPSDNQFDLSSNLNWNIDIKDISPVTRFFIPELNIPKGLHLEQDVDFESDNLLIKGSSPLVKYSGMTFSDFNIYAESRPYGTSLKTGFGEISFMEASDSSGIRIEDFEINTLIANDSLRYSLSWDRQLGDSVDISFLDGIIDFQMFPKLGMTLTDMDIAFRNDDDAWTVNPDNHISYDSTALTIDHLKFYTNETHTTYIDGTLNKTDTSLLSVEVKGWDLSIVNNALGDLGLNVFGFLSGKVDIIDPYNNLSVKSDLTIDSLQLNDNKLGNATLALNWDNKNEAFFIDMNSILEGKRATTNPINIHGHLYPKATDNNLDLSAKLENFGLDILNPFLHKYVGNIGGYLAGSIKATGSMKDPKIDGKFTVQRGTARVLYTGALYSLSGDIIADNDMFRFNNFILYDTLANVAAVEGGIRHKAFTNFELDVKIKPEKFILLSTGRFDNDLFYGTAIATGEASFTGPFNNITIAAQVNTEPNTNVTLPLNTTASVSESTFVIFTQPFDSAAVEVAPPKLLSSTTGLNLLLNVKMTPEAQVRIYLPDDLGRISAGGTGNILLGVDNYGNFNINGTYVISKGEFNLTLQQIINKKLLLNKGSTIRFSGDPLDADVDISATYEVQTSLENLNLGLDDAQMSRRIPVNCIIRMKEKLMNPELSFSIEFPSQTDDLVKSMIYSRIDTTNQVEMTRQAFSLLLLGTFSPDEANSDINYIGIAASSSINMVTNQLNNFLSQTLKGIDIGINYRGGESLSIDEFDLYLRKGLFGDRLIIDANVGMVDNTSGSSSGSSAIAGDASAELKLTNDGRWRLSGFSRSNRNDISKIGTNEYGYTYGIGVGFQRSYNNLKDIGKQQRIIREERKKKREEKRLKKAEANAGSKN